MRHIATASPFAMALALAASCATPDESSQRSESGWIGPGGGFEQSFTDEHGRSTTWRLASIDGDIRLLLGDRGAVFRGAAGRDGVRFSIGDVENAPDYTIELGDSRTVVWRGPVLTVDGEDHVLSQRGTMIFAPDGSVERAALPWDQW